MDIFAKWPCFTLQVPRLKPLPPGYPVDPKTIGEHIRKRRIDLGLLQAEAAAMIGVSEGTVWNWEHGVEPELKHMPKVIEFLGYVPFECPEDPVGRLEHFRKTRGLSIERLAKMMRRDAEQLSDWLSGRHRPCTRNQEKIERFLDRTQ